MKIIKGVNGSKARINDDCTIDYCLIDQALAQQESGEFAFKTTTNVADAELHDPLLVLGATNNDIFNSIDEDDLVHNDAATFKAFDRHKVVINNNQMLVTSSYIATQDEMDAFNVVTKKEALSLANAALQNVNEVLLSDDINYRFPESTELLTNMVQSTLDLEDWQSFSTALDEIVQDMIENPEMWDEAQEVLVLSDDDLDNLL